MAKGARDRFGDIPGFAVGWSGSATGHAGPRGGGRASALRSYTMVVRHVATGRELTRTVGPARHSKGEWRAIRERAFAEMAHELGGRCDAVGR